MERLSVCFVSFNFFPGQGLTEIFEYSRKLKRLGHEVRVIAAGRQGERKFEVVEGVPVTRIPVRTVKRRSFETLRFNLLASRILRQIVKRNCINIVHVFSYAFSILIKLGMFWSLRSKNVKWVYDIRSGPLEGREKPTLIYHLAKKLLIFESTFFDATFVIDEDVKNEVLGNNAKKEIFIAPLGADLQSFEPNTEDNRLLSRYGIEEKATILVYSGSVSSKRKLRNLILAFWKACIKFENLRLLILGEGDDVSHLKMLTQKLAISDKVFFLGYINYFDVPKFLSVADIAVSYVPIIPAFDAQPPAKTVEYLACSLPVIATSTRGNNRFVVHGWNGLLTKDDPGSLSKAIVKLSQDEGLREKLAEMARPSVEDYDWGKIVERRILPAYQKILQTQ